MSAHAEFDPSTASRSVATRWAGTRLPVGWDFQDSQVLQGVSSGVQEDEH
jgi:hypothetical protein